MNKEEYIYKLLQQGYTPVEILDNRIFPEKFKPEILFEIIINNIKGISK